ncbi:MAG: PhnD/SsuA/transferrin family substrate-binding protein [Clostridia bacterium]|nr:PhnD/SsuA/transferrin family substrate-binding protein [Clostridia bacterium]
MKNLIKIVSLLCVVALLFTFAACGKEAENSSKAETAEYKAVDMSVACLKGPTGVGMAKLMADAEEGKTANRYTFTVASSPDEISGKIVSGELNIASIPTNLAVKLYNKTGGKIKMLAVNTLGVLSFIAQDDSIKSLSDLKGKTVYSTGEGSNPEYILRNLLKENNLENDVNIQFVASNDELLAALISGNAEVAMVPEPAATTVLTKKDTLKRVLTVNDEWEKISDSKLMMGCVVALSSYIDENKEAVDKFLSEYKASIEYANNETDKAAELCAKYEIVPAAPIAKAAIPNCNLTYIDKKDMKKSIEGYFKVLFDYDPTSIGGKMPEADFYYGE